MPSPQPVLKPVVISAPFGNYIQPAGTTPTLGTYTAQARPGRIPQILKTLRYYRRIGAWVNKIGLRNPGMGWLVDKVKSGKVDASDKLVSIHGFETDEWWQLLDQCVEIGAGGIELNISCPNVGHINWPEELFDRAVATGLPVVLKVPPVNYEQAVEDAIKSGIRSLHCCNTLPVPAGGVSGKPLKPVALQCIRDLKIQPWAHEIQFIGGGGIYEQADIDDYLDAGVDVVALGTKTMNPLLLMSDGPVHGLIEYATKRVEA